MLRLKVIADNLLTLFRMGLFNADEQHNQGNNQAWHSFSLPKEDPKLH